MSQIAPASDPMWSDAATRTRLFIDLLEKHNLSDADAAVIMGRSENAVFQYRTVDKHRVIPAPLLRALMYDLQNKA